MRNIKNRKYLSWLFVLVLVFSLVSGGTSAEVMAKGSKTNIIKSVSLRIGVKKVTKKTYKMNRARRRNLRSLYHPKRERKALNMQ